MAPRNFCLARLVFRSRAANASQCVRRTVVLDVWLHCQRSITCQCKLTFLRVIFVVYDYLIVLGNVLNFAFSAILVVRSFMLCAIHLYRVRDAVPVMVRVCWWKTKFQNLPSTPVIKFSFVGLSFDFKLSVSKAGGRLAITTSSSVWKLFFRVRGSRNRTSIRFEMWLVDCLRYRSW